jgi:hypothetical protein
MTEEELARVVRACAWVKVTAGFLPYVRDFLMVRLGPDDLATKVARLNSRQTFRLWERIKDEQSEPASLSEAAAAPLARKETWGQLQR